MVNNTASDVEEPVTAHPADRLVDLLSSFSHLRSNNQVLVKKLRGSIHELRQLRTRIREENVLRASGLNGNAEAHDQPSNRYGLTRREAQVARLLAQGRSNQAIARELKISQHTARHHTQRILGKLDVHSRGEAGAKLRG